MEYLALKPVKFDRKYAVNEVIPHGVVDESRVKRLVNNGMISPLSSDQSDERGDLTLALTKEKEKLAKEKATTKKLKAEIVSLQAEIVSLQADLEKLKQGTTETANTEEAEDEEVTDDEETTEVGENQEETEENEGESDSED